MRKTTFICCLILAAAWGLAGAPFAAGETPAGDEEFGKVHAVNNTADHSKFVELQAELKTGPEVTRACLKCHTEAAGQIHKTFHWTWGSTTGDAALGKGKNTINNFCMSIVSNEPRCTSCHAGYGWKDKNFDFTAQDRVDCLVCHEQTGTYKKFPTKAGFTVEEPTELGGQMWEPPDLKKVAQSVGRPTRRNCGECHFFGGGGEGVKHGDLDSSMFKPDKELDVHMDSKGLNFTCTRCHTTRQHQVSGRYYGGKELADNRSLIDHDQVDRITCVSCHSERPHKADAKMNDHTDKVACQTCHIPAFARKNSTKMHWDWSLAGKRDANGKPIKEVKDGRAIYDGMKGAFRWEKNVRPEYHWYNGTMNYLSLTDRIDPSQPVRINRANGSYTDPHARIYPFKRHTGKQPYDPENRTFVTPHLFGKDDAAYWKSYDWGSAIASGMETAGLPYSGKFDFVETEYLFQTTHMVAPREQALSCNECHSKDGRLAKLTGFYLPGRDSAPGLDALGWGAVLAASLGVAGHGTLRAVRRRKK